MKTRIALPVGIGVLAAAATALCLFVGVTNTGLRLGIRIADHLLPGSLSVSAVQGTLLDDLQLAGLAYRDDTVDVAVKHLALSWQPASLVEKTLHIRALAVDGLILRLDEKQQPPADTKPADQAMLVLPLAVNIEKAALTSLDLFLPGNASPVRIDRINLEKTLGSGARQRIGSLQVSAPAFRLKLNGELDTGKVPGGRFSLAGGLSLPDYFPLTGSAELSGTMERLGISLQVAEPFQGLLKATATDLDGEMRWDAEIRSDRINLAEIGRGWPELILNGLTAAGRGTLANYSLQLEAGVTQGPYRDIHVRTQVEGDGSGLRLTDTHIARAEARLHGTAVLSWQDVFTWQAHLVGENIGLADINPEWPAFVLTGATITGHGSSDSYILDLETKASHGNLQDGHARIRVDGAAGGLQITDARMTLADAAVSLQGTLGWQEGISWQATIQGQAVNPALWQPAWPGRLDFGISSSGSLQEKVVKGQFDILSVQGDLRNYPLHAAGSIRLDGADLAIEDLAVRTANTTLSASGTLTDRFDIGFSLKSPDLAALWPGAAGSLQAEGQLAGDRQHPSMQLSLSGDSLVLGGSKLGAIAAEFDGNLSPNGSLVADIRATDMAVADFPVAELTAQLRGTTAAHELTTDIRSHADSLHLRLAGGLDESSWRGSFSRVDLQLERLGNWLLAAPAGTAISPEGITVDQLCLVKNEEARICAAGNLQQNGSWQAEARIDSLPLKLFPIVHDRVSSLDGIATGVLLLDGDRTGLRRSNLQLGTDTLSLVVALPDNQQRAITWHRNDLRATLVDGEGRASLQSVLQDGSSIDAALQLHELQHRPLSLASSRLEGTVSIDVRELEVLASLTFPVIEPSGSLLGELKLQGPAARPQLIGTARLRQGKMAIPSLGIGLEELEMSLDGQDTLFKLTASARSGEGSARFAGDLLLSDPSQPHLTFDLKGDRFVAVDLPEWKVVLSPNIQGTLTREKGELTGIVSIPEAMIAPRGLSGRATASKDVVIVGPQGQERRTDWPLSLHLSILAGDDVRVDAFGLRGKINGQLEVFDRPGKPVTGEGILTVADGTFAVYGRQLAIQTGRLLYNGNPIDNPGIDVRAENTSKEVTTGIQVSGFLREPSVSFYSTPPMDENAIIARLLMNTSLLGSAEEDQGLLGSSAAEVKIESGKSQEDLSLVIGTWLTPDLFVSYGKNLLKESGSFNTRYLLGLGFSLQTESGATQSGADLKYEIDR